MGGGSESRELLPQNSSQNDCSVPACTFPPIIYSVNAVFGVQVVPAPVRYWKFVFSYQTQFVCSLPLVVHVQLNWAGWDHSSWAKGMGALGKSPFPSTFPCSCPWSSHLGMGDALCPPGPSSPWHQNKSLLTSRNLEKIQLISDFWSDFPLNLTPYLSCSKQSL